MTETSEQIRALLVEAFAPDKLEVEDESWKHAGHAGARESGGGHFVVHISARAFEGLSRLQAHRRILEVLRPLMRSKIHALSIDIRPVR